MSESLSIFQTLEKVLSLVNIVIYFTVIVVALNCIWRVDKQFDRFLKLVTIAISLVPFRLVLGVLGLEQNEHWALIVRIFGFLAGLLLIVAFTDLLRTVKQINKENI